MNILKILEGLDKKMVILNLASFSCLTPFFILYLMTYPAFDDFAFAAQIRDGNTNWIWARYMIWSPRLFSDSLIYLYNQIWGSEWLLTSKYQLVLVVLLVLLFLSFYYFLLSVFPNTIHLKTETAICASLVFLYSCFAIHNPAYLFYWSPASTAYMTTLSFLLLSCGFMVQWMKKSRNHLLLFASISLILCGWSSEYGAIFQLIFGLSFLGINNLSRWRGPLILAIVSVLTFLVVALSPGASNRFDHDVVISQNTPAGNILPSVISALKTLLIDVKLTIFLILLFCLFIYLLLQKLIEKNTNSNEQNLRKISRYGIFLFMGFLLSYLACLSLQYYSWGNRGDQHHNHIQLIMLLLAFTSLAIFVMEFNFLHQDLQNSNKGYFLLFFCSVLLFSLGWGMRGAEVMHDINIYSHVRVYYEDTYRQLKANESIVYIQPEPLRKISHGPTLGLKDHPATREIEQYFRKKIELN